jgi:hypothetical protein
MPRAGWQWKSFVPLQSGTKIATNSRLHAQKKGYCENHLFTINNLTPYPQKSLSPHQKLILA